MTRPSHNFWEVLSFSIMFGIAMIMAVLLVYYATESRTCSLTTVQGAEVGR